MTTTVLPESTSDAVGYSDRAAPSAQTAHEPSQSLWARSLRSGRVVFGGGILLVIILLCVATLVLTLRRSSSFYYDRQDSTLSRTPPRASPVAAWYGYDGLGRSILARCLL